MAEVKLSDVKMNLKSINCKLKTQMDGTWAIHEPKGKRVIVPTLEAVHDYYLEKTGAKTAVAEPAASAPAAVQAPAPVQAAPAAAPVSTPPAPEPVSAPKPVIKSVPELEKSPEQFPFHPKVVVEDAVKEPVTQVENEPAPEPKPKVNAAVDSDDEHWQLQATGNWLDGQTFVLKGKTIIGRDASCTITIPGSHLSRRHAEFLAYGATLKMKDLGSSNGCYVNGKKVKESLLKEGDEIKLDVLTFKVVAPVKQPAQKPVVADEPAHEVKVEKPVVAEAPKAPVTPNPVAVAVTPASKAISAGAPQPAAVGSTQISDDQKRAIVAVNAFIYQIKEDRLQKGLNFIHSDIRKYVLFNGCPEPLLDKAMNYAESKLYKDCMDKVLIKRPFENHLGEKDVMYFDARYASVLGLK